MRPIALLLAAGLLVLASCGSDGDGGFALDLGLSAGNYQILDLSTGQVSSRVAVPDLATNPAYRTTSMVFRAVETGAGTGGSRPGSFGRQDDEAVRQITTSRYYLAVFETTQAQWRLIAGTRPETALAAADATAFAIDTGNNQLPVVNLSAAEAAAGAASGSSRLGHRLSLPSAEQWEYACRAGTTGLFSWGDSLDEAVVRSCAVVAETLDGSDGLRTVGGRQANPFGFYDMHGNAWELTTDGAIRGGSWRDTLSQARSANRGPVLDSETAHALVGVRLILVP